MQEYSRLLGDAVREARTQFKYTQSEVAGKVGIDTRTVLNIENYHGNPKMEVLYPLIRALSIDPKTIFYPEQAAMRPALQKLQFYLANCTEEEASMLLPICKVLLEVQRSKNA